MQIGHDLVEMAGGDLFVWELVRDLTGGLTGDLTGNLTGDLTGTYLRRAAVGFHHSSTTRTTAVVVPAC